MSARLDASGLVSVPARDAQTDRFKLKLHEVAPENIIPNGDRYVVEVIDIDDKVLLGQILVITQAQEPKNPNDPMADPQVERRGVLAAVVISAGNGHLLGLPDLAPQGDQNERPGASVPMFYAPGDVVLVDHNAKGRALSIALRECRIVNQIDLLAKIEGVQLVHKDGKWETN